MSPGSKARTSTRSMLGKHGEDLVAAWLTRDGFKILERNYRRQCGEVDLIARKKHLIAFIEVKTRSKHYFELSQVVTPAKQRKIIRTAQTYIIQHEFQHMIFRFDIALIEGNNNITYIPNAFAVTEESM